MLTLAYWVMAERGHPAHPLLAEVLCTEGDRAVRCAAAAEPALALHAPADRLPPAGAVALQEVFVGIYAVVSLRALISLIETGT